MPVIDEYEQSLKIYRDLKGVIDTAFEEGKIEGMIEGKIKGIIEGKIEGIMEGKIEVARGLKENNVPMEIIIKTTGLTKEQIETL
jgi:predicted transposase/invertase (TIGR01784 family)